MSSISALKFIAFSVVVCTTAAMLTMSLLTRVMAVCPFGPPSLAKECRDELWSITIRAGVDAAWKGVLFGAAIGAMIVYWKSKKS